MLTWLQFVFWATVICLGLSMLAWPQWFARTEDMSQEGTRGKRAAFRESMVLNTGLMVFVVGVTCIVLTALFNA